MVHMVHVWCRRKVLNFQHGDTVCTIDTMGFVYSIENSSDGDTWDITRVHESDGVHGAHGVTHLKLQQKTTAPWVHH